MAGKPSGAAPAPILARGTVAGTDSVWDSWAPSTPPLPPPAGLADWGRLEFQSVSRQGRCKEGANPEAKKGVARPVGAAGCRGLCGARSSPRLREPAGREWEGRGSHCCDAAASAGKRRVPGTAPAGGEGAPAADGSPAQRPGRVPQGNRRSRSGGWRARVWGRPAPPPSPACGDPANPGRSRVTLKPPSCPAGERRGQLPHSAPQKVCPGGGGGTHVLRRRWRPLLGLGFQLLDALRLGAGGHCGARARVLAHADAGSRAGGRLRGSSRGAGLTLLGAGRTAPGTLCAPRRLRASPAARARPHGPGPRAAASPPRDARPLAAKLLRARGPAGLSLRPGPHARLGGEGALGPAPARRLPALPSRFPRPQLCAGVSSSPRTPRGRRAGGGGAAPGDRRPPPPPAPGATTRAKSVTAARPREEMGPSCGGAGGEVAAPPGAGAGRGAPRRPWPRYHQPPSEARVCLGAGVGCSAHFPSPTGLKITWRLQMREGGRGEVFTKLAASGLTGSELGAGCWQDGILSTLLSLIPSFRPQILGGPDRSSDSGMGEVRQGLPGPQILPTGDLCDSAPGFIGPG